MFGALQKGKGLFHLNDVPLGQFPPRGDPHVIAVQLHHGCRNEERMCVCVRETECMYIWHDLPSNTRPVQGSYPDTRRQETGGDQDQHAAGALLPLSGPIVWDEEPSWG